MNVEWRTYRSSRVQERPGLHGVSVWWDGEEPTTAGRRWWTHFRRVWTLHPGWKPLDWHDVPDDASGIVRTRL